MRWGVVSFWLYGKVFVKPPPTPTPPACAPDRNAPPPPRIPPAAPALPARPVDWPTPALMPPIGVATATPVPVEVLTAPAPAIAPPRPWLVVAAAVAVLLTAAPPATASVEAAWPCVANAATEASREATKSFFILGFSKGTGCSHALKAGRTEVRPP